MEDKQLQLLQELAERLKRKQENITHLEWIYDRMKNVHSENENYDYMIKFSEIINDIKELKYETIRNYKSNKKRFLGNL